MFGALTAALACALLGIWAAHSLRARSRMLRAWQRALAGMYASCAYARADSAQILRAGAYEIPALGDLARAVELNGADAGMLFESQKTGRLRPEEYTVLLSVMRAAASGGREEIAAAIAYAQERFRSFCEACDGKRDADARMYVTLGLLSGVCAFLILW
ncbi:MAG: hypothetical protein IJ157_08730 [Clostridia bacterium]|nr:hypothetical protein [Clostridia bacterium]